MIKLIMFCVGVFVLCGCEHVPHKIYEIETKGGEVIKLSCPTIDPSKSTLTYYDGRCVLVK